MLTQLDTIKTATTALLRIINDILDFSKVLALNYLGGTELRLKTINLRLILHNFQSEELLKVRWNWFSFGGF